jgi:[acyl-carrier-protein] S-malonyltransferase
VEHLTAGVDWVAAVSAMARDGVTTFLEVGPGRVLTGLVKRIAPAADARSLDDPSAPGGLALPALAAT